MVRVNSRSQSQPLLSACSHRPWVSLTPGFPEPATAGVLGANVPRAQPNQQRTYWRIGTGACSVAPGHVRLMGWARAAPDRIASTRGEEGGGGNSVAVRRG